MLLARTPVRISLAGGGTDPDSHYGRFGGAKVLMNSTAEAAPSLGILNPLHQRTVSWRKAYVC